ncbi:transporter substrate-binding domain-containing protein [Moraxella bovis]|uniref:transporter substrate-binding domain-containing protein n=1 Tax=Moraxella bovis TaxID=476 RepID=UPI002225E9E8|nr:transporter substrate-binding domain-containing protein [Moraxella bovis]
MAFSDLVNDKVEAVYAHENILRHYAKGQPNLKFNFNGTGEGFDYYNMVVVAKKGNDELIAKINAGIQDVHQNGTYQKLHSQWFGVEAPTPMIKNKNRY